MPSLGYLPNISLQREESIVIILHSIAPSGNPEQRCVEREKGQPSAVIAMNGRSGREWPYLYTCVIFVDFKGLWYCNNRIALFSDLTKGYKLRIEQPPSGGDTSMLTVSYSSVWSDRKLLLTTEHRCCTTVNWSPYS